MSNQTASRTHLRPGLTPARFIPLWILLLWSFAGCESEGPVVERTRCEDLETLPLQEGIYEITVEERDAESGDLIDSCSFQENLCLGDLDEGDCQNCDGTITMSNGAFSISCVDVSPFGECTLETTMEMSGSFTTTNFTSSGSFCAMWTGQECGVESGCIAFSMTAQRVADGDGPCDDTVYLGCEEAEFARSKFRLLARFGRFVSSR